MAMDFLNGQGGVQYVNPMNPLPISNSLQRAVYSDMNFVPSASYAQGASFGGLQTINLSSLTGLNMAGQPIKFNKLLLTVEATTVSAANTFAIQIYSSLPATTFTDGAVPTYTNTDFATINFFNTSGNTTLLGTSIAVLMFIAPQGLQTIPCDASGKVYVSLTQATSTALTLTTPVKAYLNFEFAY